MNEEEMEDMSEKEAEAFERVVAQALNAIAIFRATGQKMAMRAANEQVDKFTEEFGTRIVFVHCPSDSISE